LLDFRPPGDPTCTTDITLTDLLITNGRSGGDSLNAAGGGIYNNHAILTLNGSTEVSGNHAAYGGGIASYGTVTLKDAARVVDNTATAGGGIYIVGAALNACASWTGAISPNSPNDAPAPATIACPAAEAPGTEVRSATISGSGLSGEASLVVPARGRATAAFSLDRLKPDVSVSARIVAGAACDATARTITSPPGYTTTEGGTWRQRWVFDGTDLIWLRARIRANTPLWFQVGTSGSHTCARLSGV
jgi:hypothetical protein